MVPPIPPSTSMRRYSAHLNPSTDYSSRSLGRTVGVKRRAAKKGSQGVHPMRPVRVPDVQDRREKSENLEKQQLIGGLRRRRVIGLEEAYARCHRGPWSREKFERFRFCGGTACWIKVARCRKTGSGTKPSVEPTVRTGSLGVRENSSCLWPLDSPRGLAGAKKRESQTRFAIT